MNVIDSEGKSRKAVLDNALLVPSYPQDIFSVQAAAQEGATITFNPGGAELVSNKGVLFNINKMGKLYYLNTHQGRSLRGGKGGNCPPWDFQFLWFFKLIIPKSNTEIATWYLLRRHCPPAYLGQATALLMTLVLVSIPLM